MYESWVFDWSTTNNNNNNSFHEEHAPPYAAHTAASAFLDASAVHALILSHHHHRHKPPQLPWEPDGLALRRIIITRADPHLICVNLGKRHSLERTNSLVLGGDCDVGGFSIAKRGSPHYSGFGGGFGGGVDRWWWVQVTASELRGDGGFQSGAARFRTTILSIV
ncbi:hypothetical protein U1Q18_008674 [Sarracenia purpurea var. burkii]